PRLDFIEDVVEGPGQKSVSMLWFIVEPTNLFEAEMTRRQAGQKHTAASGAEIDGDISGSIRVHHTIPLNASFPARPSSPFRLGYRVAGSVTIGSMAPPARSRAIWMIGVTSVVNASFSVASAISASHFS